MAIPITVDAWFAAATALTRDTLAVCRSSVYAAALAALLSLVWSISALYCAAWVKDASGRTGYSRKLFHLLIFTAAGAAHLVGGLPFVCILGGATSLVLAYAVARGAGHPWYEALARESDAPYRTHYIVVSYLATLLGGVLNNFLTGHFALLGYLVCGLGDAAGEPVGARWGRHWYLVPGSGRPCARRSLEGSTAVFAVSAAALLAGLVAMTGTAHAVHLTPEVLVIALVCALAEALSPHGWDNITMQLAPSLLAARWLTDCIAGP